MPEENSDRRPLKTRSAAWAGVVSRLFLRLGFKPDGVSLFGIPCAALAGGAILYATQRTHPWIFWLLAAAGVQCRLLCNMLDGMLAVEGGLKSPLGVLFNELPDRLEDALILVPLGYAAGTDLGIALAWTAACGAIATAYLRAMGASLTGHHDFRGPMAKPHRMAAVTLLCFIMVGSDLGHASFPILQYGLVAIVAGIAVTCFRRIRLLSRTLTEKP